MKDHVALSVTKTDQALSVLSAMSIALAPALSEVSSEISKLASENGSVNLLYLHEIQDVLAQSHDLRDAELYSWIKNHFFHLATETPDAEARKPVRTVRGYEIIYEAFMRAQHLTNRAVDKWPFLNVGGYKMQRSVVKKMVGAQNSIGTPSTFGSWKDANTPATGPIRQMPKANDDATTLQHATIETAKKLKENNIATSSPNTAPGIMNIDEAFSPTDSFNNTFSLAASAKSEATNLDKLPMSSLLKQPKRKSEAATVPARQPKKTRGGKAASASNVSTDAEEKVGPSEIGAFTSAHKDETQTRPPQLRVSGRFASRSTPTRTPTSSFTSPATREIRRRPSVLQNNPSLEVDGDAFMNFSSVTQEAAINDKASEKLQEPDLHAVQKDKVASKSTASAMRIAFEELEKEQVTSPTDSVIPPGSPASATTSLYSRPGFGTTLAPASTMAPSTNLSTETQAVGINDSTPAPASNLTAMTNINKTYIPTLNSPFNALALINDTGSSDASQAPREFVQFYARVQTPNGLQAIALDPSLFTGPDVDLVQKYAVWKQEEAGTGMNLSYEQFCKVVGFATIKVEE